MITSNSYYNVSKENRSQIRKDIVKFSIDAGLPVEPSFAEEILGEILQNIIRHAYMDVGGKVLVRIIDNNKNVFIMIRDYGCGFVNKIDFKENIDFCNQIGGVGLNLVAQMVNPNNITISSFPGEGTTLFLRFKKTKPLPS